MGRRLLIDYSQNSAPLQPLGDDSNGSLVGEDRLGMSMRFHERVMANPPLDEEGIISAKGNFAAPGTAKKPKANNPSAIYPLESLLASLSSIRMPPPEPKQPRPKQDEQEHEERTAVPKALPSFPSAKITFRLPPRRRHRIARSHAKLHAHDDASRTMEDASHRSHYTTATAPTRGRMVDDRSTRTDNSRTISVCTAPAAVSRQRNAPPSYQTIPSNKLLEMQQQQQRNDTLQEQSEEDDEEEDKRASFLPSSLAAPAAPAINTKKKTKKKKRNVSLDDFFRKNSRDSIDLDSVKEDNNEDDEDAIPKTSNSTRSTALSRRGSSRTGPARRKLPGRSKSFDDASSFASMSQMSLSEMSQSRPIGKRGKRIMPRPTKSFHDSNRIASNAPGDASVNASSNTRRGGRRPNRQKDKATAKTAGEEGNDVTDKAPPPLRRMPSRSKSSCDGGSYRLMRQESGFSFMAGSRIRIRTTGEGSTRSTRTGGTRSSRSQRILRSKDDSDTENGDDGDASVCSDMSQSYPQGQRSRREVMRGVNRAKSCEDMESMLGFLRS